MLYQVGKFKSNSLSASSYQDLWGKVMGTAMLMSTGDFASLCVAVTHGVCDVEWFRLDDYCSAILFRCLSTVPVCMNMSSVV